MGGPCLMNRGPPDLGEGEGGDFGTLVFSFGHSCFDTKTKIPFEVQSLLKPTQITVTTINWYCLKLDVLY